jgi:hypothetical protein
MGHGIGTLDRAGRSQNHEWSSGTNPTLELAGKELMERGTEANWRGVSFDAEPPVCAISGSHSNGWTCLKIARAQRARVALRDRAETWTQTPIREPRTVVPIVGERAEPQENAKARVASPTAHPSR